LLLGFGTVVGADPVLPTPAAPSKTPSVNVNTPVATPQELPKAPKLTPLPAAPALPGTPVEAGPAPKEVLPKPAVSANPPPMPLPKRQATAIGFHPWHAATAGAGPCRAGICSGISGGSLPVLATTGGERADWHTGFLASVLFGGSNPTKIPVPACGSPLAHGSIARAQSASKSAVLLDRECRTDGSTDVARGGVVAICRPDHRPPSAIRVSFPALPPDRPTSTASASPFGAAKDWCGVDGWSGLASTVGHFRYRRLMKNSAYNTITPLGPNFVPGTVIASNDTIETANEFFGGVIGIDCQKDYGCWSLNVRPSVAIGRMRNSTRRDGVTVISVPGTPDLVFPGGIYNLTSNIGEIDSQDWTAIPELDVRVSKQIWNCVRLSIGYTAMCFPLLARAGEQIDPYVNPNLIPPIVPGGPAQPSPLLERSQAWLHGFTVSGSAVLIRRRDVAKRPKCCRRDPQLKYDPLHFIAKRQFEGGGLRRFLFSWHACVLIATPCGAHQKEEAA
jgi:hypothetical protein